MSIGISVPHTSKVIILFTAFILLAFKNIHGVSVEPGYVNAYTYTNLTIRGAVNVTAVEGAYVDFVIQTANGIVMGVKPLRPSGNITLKVDNKTLFLPVVNRCRIDINAANMTSRIEAEAAGNCSGVALYVNGTRQPGLKISYVPQYSGVYRIVATNGVFYQKTNVIVLPNITLKGNTFGEVLQILFTPPLKYGVLNVGGMSLAVRDMAVIDTWSLGAGNFTMALYVGGVVATYNLTINRATPKIEFFYKSEYVYGEPLNISVKVLVGRREYRASLQLALNGSVLQALAPFSLNIPLLPSGSYRLVVRAAGDRNITSAEAAVLFRVLPAPVQLDVKINGSSLNPLVVEYGKVLWVAASAKSLVAPVGELSVYIDGARGGWLIDTLKIGPGAHNITVVFNPANRNFKNAAVSTVVYVIPATPDIKVNKTFSITYGEELVVPISVTLFNRPINATLKVEISGRHRVYNFTLTVVNGRGVLKIKDLPAGTYLATATLLATPGLLSTSAAFNIFVSSASVLIEIQAPKRGVYGEFVPINVSVLPRVPGRLSVLINGTVIYAGNTTSYQGLWPPPSGGVFQITAQFKSLDPNFSDAESVTFVFIDRAKCSIKFKLRGDYSNNNTIFVLRRYMLQYDTNLPVVIYVNGSRAGETIVFNSTGVYNITVYFPGDASYYPCGASQMFTVGKNPVTVLIQSTRRIALIDAGVPVTISLTSPVGMEEGVVKIYKINKIYNTTEVDEININKNMTLLLKFKNTGVYEIYALYEGNRYLLPNKSNTIIVTVESSYFGIPLFLLAIYSIAIGGGLAVAFLAKKILKWGI